VIALFVVVFAAFVVVALRRGHRAPAAPAEVPKKLDDKAVVNNMGPGNYELRDPLKGGAIKLRITYGNQLTYADGSMTFGSGVKFELPDKNGRQIIIEGQEARTTVPPGKQVGTVDVTGGTKLTTSDGIVVTSASASYNDAEQMTRIPGPLSFKKGRMTGSGVGGTYDQARGVLWLLDQAKVDVAPDKNDKKGSGAIHVTSKAAGMARLEHYMKFTGEARLDGEGHNTAADEATAYLTEDDERITKMELRGNSHMTGKPGVSGPQDMRATNIDLLYGDDGRTLQSARLVENASIQLPGEKGKQGRRIAGKAMDLAMAPDGATVTNLVANENVQVDLPPDGDTPARRIRAASLMATGAAGAGIQAATFSGGVEFRESRAARDKLAEIDRTAKSDRLDVKTKPGFGDLESAAFHSNVRFTEGTKTTADAPMAVYSIAQDRLDLSPGEGDKGRGPHVSDGRISVDAKAIQLGLSNQKMKADTNVRSVMTSQSGRGAKPEETVKVPSMLKQDEPVNVKSNRLDYDGASSLATYEGNARLWQGVDTDIKADKILLDDKSGNLHATTNVISVMVLTQADDKKTADKKPAAAKSTAPKTPAETTTTTADELLYEDAKHRATYTGHAHMNGPNGDVTAEKIELFLAEQGGQLERAEADGNVVSRQDNRRAYGRHLTYLAKDDLDTMTGSPVKIFEQTPTNCRITEGTTLVFDRTLSTTTASGTTGQRTRSEPSCPPEGSF
jgi:lipopolysaccharide export system protein LptA